MKYVNQSQNQRQGLSEDAAEAGSTVQSQKPDPVTSVLPGIMGENSSILLLALPVEGNAKIFDLIQTD